MSIDKTTLNRIRIAIQHALCSTIHNDVNHKSMAEACVDLGIIEKAEDFDIVDSMLELKKEGMIQ